MTHPLGGSEHLGTRSHTIDHASAATALTYGRGADEHGVQSFPSRSPIPQVAPVLPGDSLSRLW